MFEEDLRARLNADAGIAAKVAQGASAWGDRPQASGLPAITLDDIADPRDQHMTDFQALCQRQVQIDVWSLDKLEARDLRELVIAALAPAATVGSSVFRRGFIVNRASDFEKLGSGPIVYRERLDWKFWFSPLS